MIYITQGHEESIATEVLVKSMLMLPQKKLTKFIYVVNKKVIIKNLKSIGINYRIKDDYLYLTSKHKIRCYFINSSEKTSSLASIDYCLSRLKNEDILITSPTTKDKFKNKDQQLLGHTEYLRDYYKKSMTMNFINNKEQVLILTDHVPIKMVVSKLSVENVIEQIKTSLSGLSKYYQRSIETVLISGINPHAGENGLIGNEDTIIKNALVELKKIYPKIRFEGPIPGDTLPSKIKVPIRTLQVFCHHDQALTYFKHKNKFLGINTTFGLEFLRLSVDHGTAQDLYGLNKANPLGSYFVLLKALEINESRKS